MLRPTGMWVGVRERIEDPWRVRVLGLAGRPVGAGVLLTGRRVLTCAHVVESALGAAADRAAEGAPVSVDFPASLEEGPWSAEVVRGGWAPPVGERADVAVLKLHSAAPEDTGPATLRHCGRVVDRPVRVFGEADAAGPGVWARTVLVGAGGLSPDWIQMAPLSAQSERVRRGYSGAGVVDVADGSVRGIAVAAGPDAGLGTSWMIPVEAALCYCPLLADAVTAEPSPAHGPGRFPAWPTQAEQRLTEALVRLPSIQDPQRRNSIIRDTGDDIAMLAERSSVLLQDVRALISLCLQYTDGVDRLAAAARWYERGSRPMADFDVAWLALRPRGD